MDQLSPDNKIIATINFILFDKGSHSIKGTEIITFAQLVRDMFSDWINRKTDWIVKFTYKEIKDREPDGSDLILWKEDRIKFAAVLFLYAIVPHFRVKNNRPDKHGQLILDLLNTLIDGTEFNRKYLQDCKLEYYWHEPTMDYVIKIIELLDMSDDQFNKLGDFYDWLNKFE